MENINSKSLHWPPERSHDTQASSSHSSNVFFEKLKKLNSAKYISEISTDTLSEELFDNQARNIVIHVLSSLSTTKKPELLKSDDIAVINKIFSSVYEALEEKILNESEAKAVIEFITSKFVERRLNLILQEMFDIEKSNKYSFKGIVGKINEPK